MLSQVKAGAILSYFNLFINILIGLIYTPWMIKSIGQSNYGLYTLAISVINLFVFDFGLGASVQRFVAKYVAERDYSKAKQVVSVIFRLYILISCVVLIILIGVYFFIPQIYEGLTLEELQKFKVVYVVAAIFSVLSFPLLPADGILVGCEKFVQVKLCDLTNKVIIVVLMTSCLLLGYGLYALVITNAIAGIVCLSLKYYYVVKLTDITFSLKFWDNIFFKAIVGFSIWVLISALCSRCIITISPSILGIYHNADIIALFSIAVSVEGYFYLFANALNSLFLPKVSRYIADGNEHELQGLMNRVGSIQYFILGLIYIGMISFGQQFLNLWVGHNFESAYLCFVILILPSFISLPQTIARTTIIAKNKVKVQAICNLVQAIANLLLAFPLSKYYGAMGLCISISISAFILLISTNIVYIKILNFDIFSYFKLTFCKYLLPYAILLYLGYEINLHIRGESWGIFFLKIILLTIIYLLIVPMVVGKQNRVYMFQTIGTILKRK